MAVLHKAETETLFDLLQLSSLIVLGPDPRFQLDSEDLRRKLELFCWHFNLLFDDAPGAPAPPQAPAAVSGPEKVKGRQAILDQMRGGQCKQREAGDAKMDNARSQCTVHVRAFLDRRGFPGCDDIHATCKWWALTGSTTYKHMTQPARFLLTLPAGNAFLERLFGRCRTMLRPNRRATTQWLPALSLNAVALRLPGYPQQAEETESS